MRFLMIRDRFDHEIGTVANVRTRPEKHGAGAKGQDVLIERGLP
jgi:hypothetical protein